MITTFIVISAAVLMDLLFGEPKRAHPLVAIGHMAHFLDRHLNRPSSPGRGKSLGVLAVAIMLVPAVSLLLVSSGLWWHIASVFILYICISPRSLIQHGNRVYTALAEDDLATARLATGRMVSRDTADLDRQALLRATTESLLENGSDGIFAPLFWFVLAGTPGVVAYRIINTLDAMWGYKHAPYRDFGWCAARLDDVVNYIPARMTALLYTLSGWRFSNWAAMRRQAGDWESPNAGYTIASGAWALDVQLGGISVYQGRKKKRPYLGSVNNVDLQHIPRTHRLLLRALLLFLSILGGVSVLA